MMMMVVVPRPRGAGDTKVNDLGGTAVGSPVTRGACRPPISHPTIYHSYQAQTTVVLLGVVIQLLYC